MRYAVDSGLEFNDEATTGVIPGLVPGIHGAAHAIGAARAAEIGLVHRIVPDETLRDEALEVSYPTAIDREAERMLRTQGTDDHKEAVRAFVDMRKPVFKGRWPPAR